ncbi:hypothetical protein BGZ95_009594 [Linnemannia exigua]|uniref:Tc1-like transposase DDE domain-containing protein n=1 Tax=Linnemannia exigua TaxID=604196 RepID=A0AAD4DEB0_9FUNG|nr:hypothetical protein BGZ95_009594 [Linnemannia exigua]
MDNAKFHKTQKVKDAFTGSGLTLLLLPVCSPQLNDDESVFSSVKAHVRQEVVHWTDTKILQFKPKPLLDMLQVV